MNTQTYISLIEDFFGDAVRLDLDAPLTQIVTDSFLLVELVIHLSDEVDSLVQREDFDRVVTVRDLIEVVEAGRHARVG